MLASEIVVGVIEPVLADLLKDPRVRVYRQPNQKLPRALTHAHAYARGEFITWTSSDNLMAPEALRVLAPEGRIVIIDSPVYRHSSSGAAMVAERQEQFKAKYGFASDNLQGENYLTYARLKELARELSLRWKFITPFYGLRWMFRPLLTKVRGRREPAKFHLLVGRKNQKEM